MLIRSRRKSLSLTVVDDEVRVRSPYHVSKQDIDTWVQSRSLWINQQKASIKAKAEEVPSIKHDGHCYLFGVKIHIVFSDQEPQVSIQGDQVMISAIAKEPTVLFSQWLQKKAITHLSARVDHWAEIIGVATKVSQVVFKITKTKWGHCTSSGVIQLNWYLVMAPKTVIDYVVIHELCHLLVMNHSADFWAEVQQYSPHFQEHKQWLRREGHKLWL